MRWLVALVLFGAGCGSLQERAPPIVCDARHTGPTCAVCTERFTDADCGRCSPRFAGDDCASCAVGFDGPRCDRCVDGFAGEGCATPVAIAPKCTAADRGQPGDPTFLEIVPARETTCARRTDGTVACWGARPGAPPGRFLDLAGQHWMFCGRHESKKVECWGDPFVAPNVPFEQIGVGYFHGCGLDPYGRMLCWGSDGRIKNMPRDVPFDRIVLAPVGGCGRARDGSGWYCSTESFRGDGFAGVDYLDVDVHQYAYCGVAPDGRVTCRGGTEGVPGLFSPPADRFVSVSVGLQHACGLTVEGRAKCWGDNSQGQLNAPDIGCLKQVAVGHRHSCAVRFDDTITCWGDNEMGQLDVPR